MGVRLLLLALAAPIHVSSLRPTSSELEFIGSMESVCSEFQERTCIQTITYGGYSYDELNKCLEVPCEGKGAEKGACLTGLKALGDDLNVDALLTSEAEYWPKYWKSDKFITRKDMLTERGLTTDSFVAKLVKRVNRLPFLEMYLRTCTNEWTTSNLNSALQLVHFVDTTVKQAGKTWNSIKKTMDAGCGTGFVVTVLAQAVDASAKVVCVEYVDWVHSFSEALAHRGNLYDPAINEAELLKRIDWVWGDAINMKDFATEETLQGFDLIIFGMSLPHDISSLPGQVAAALNEGGLLIGPQCNGDGVEQSDKESWQYCVGQWRSYKKQGKKLVAMDVPFVFPSRFLLPPSFSQTPS